MFTKNRVSFVVSSAFLLCISCKSTASDNDPNLDPEEEPAIPVVYFAADDGTTGSELWKTDGTASNTQLVKDINTQGFSSPGGFIEFKGAIFFAANDGIHGRELWKFEDNTASLVKDIDIAPPESEFRLRGSQPRAFVEFNEALYFTAGGHVWTTDGTESGTLIVAEDMFMFSPTIYKQALYFRGPNGVWKSDDGTPANAQLFISGVSSELVMAGDLLFFIHSDVKGRELWSTDGSELGTQMVADINPAGDGIPGQSMVLVAHNNEVYFIGEDADGIELWKSNGTAKGTVQVKDINPTGDSLSQFASSFSIASANDLLFFIADDGVHGSEVWVSDGTGEGTNLLADVNDSPASSYLNLRSNILVPL